MAKSKEPANYFYPLLVVLGIVFVITAFGYATMAYRAIAPQADANDHPLTSLMDRYGMQAMTVELALLALTCFAAMWLDRCRIDRAAREADRPDSPE